MISINEEKILNIRYFQRYFQKIIIIILVSMVDGSRIHYFFYNFNRNHNYNIMFL